MKKMTICKATDCKYNCRISVAGNCCNYLTMTGELRTVENIDGEVVRKHLIKDGKCDLYDPSKGERNRWESIDW